MPIDILTIDKEMKNVRTIFKTIDILGKKTQTKQNTPLLYIYDDGTIEKKMILETE